MGRTSASNDMGSLARIDAHNPSAIQQAIEPRYGQRNRDIGAFLLAEKSRWIQARKRQFSPRKGSGFRSEVSVAGNYFEFFSIFPRKIERHLRI
jgi:hypothetical protein